MSNIDEKYESEYIEFLKSFILQNTPKKLGPFKRIDEEIFIGGTDYKIVSVGYKSYDFPDHETSVLLSINEKRFIQVSIKFDNNKNIFAVNDRFADLHQITNTYDHLIKQLTHNMLG